MKTIQILIVQSFSFILLLSCNNEKIIDHAYNYCDNNGYYGELFFYSDSLVAIYGIHDCDTLYTPVCQTFKYRFMSCDTIAFYNAENGNALYSVKYWKPSDSTICLEFIDDLNNDTLLLNRMNLVDYYQPFILSKYSLDEWQENVYYPDFMRRMRIRECQCDSKDTLFFEEQLDDLLK